MSRDSEPLRARWRRARASAEDGSAVLEFLLVGVLVMCPLFYAVVSFARIQAGSYAVAQAARAASRAFVTADDVGAAYGRAQASAALAFSDHHVDGGSVRMRCAPTCLARGGTATARTSVSIPLPLVPGFLSAVMPTSITLHGEHTDHVPRYGERR